MRVYFALVYLSYMCFSLCHLAMEIFLHESVIQVLATVETFFLEWVSTFQDPILSVD